MQDRTIVAARTKVGSDPLLLVDRSRAGIALVTMNRPEQRNALSLDMIDRLHARLTRLASDATVSAVVLAANGPVFSSGHDLKELTAHRADADKGLAFYTEAMTRCSAMMQAIGYNSEVLEEIAGASRRQAVSLETINEAVRQMDAASADSSKLAQDFSSSSMQAKARAAELDAIVDRFTLDRQSSIAA